jgi:hypothetical protein
MVRLIIALVLASHGIGHLMGFLAAWTPASSPFTGRPWVFTNGVTMTSSVGKVLGLLWLAPLVGFVVGAFGLWLQTGWWQPMLVASAAVSLPLVLPWWNAIPRLSYAGAVIVDIAVLAALLA